MAPSCRRRGRPRLCFVRHWTIRVAQKGRPPRTAASSVYSEHDEAAASMLHLNLHCVSRQTQALADLLAAPLLL